MTAQPETAARRLARQLQWVPMPDDEDRDTDHGHDWPGSAITDIQAEARRDFLDSMKPDPLAVARASAVAPLLEALRTARETMRHADYCGEWCVCGATAALVAVDEILAATPPVPSDHGASLDVERLAAAFRRSGFSVAYDSDAIPDVAEAIAAEYARLTPSQPAEESR